MTKKISYEAMTSSKQLDSFFNEPVVDEIFGEN